MLLRIISLLAAALSCTVLTTNGGAVAVKNNTLLMRGGFAFLLGPKSLKIQLATAVQNESSFVDFFF